MAASDQGLPKVKAYLFDTFDVSVPLGILRQAGVRLKIQDLPFQMLLVLLERRGELVTKEELGNRLWDRKTNVEVDKSLYVMAGKLREVLGDDAAQPRFIKTVSGRGYCFIGDVIPILESVADSAAPHLVQKPKSHSLLAGRLQGGTGAGVLRGRTRRLLAAFVLAGICILAVSLLAYRYFHRPLASDQDKVVLGGFTNNTGNPDLDRTLSSALQLKVQESPYLSLIPEQDFQALVKDPDKAPLPEELRACASLNAQLLLKGKILAVAQGYRVLLMVWRCASGRLLTTEQADATSQAGILSALDLATERMRRRLGESDASLQKFNVPLVHATTPSLAALKAFTLGEEKRSQGRIPESIASYKLALDLDSQFALALARLGTIYHNTAQYSLSEQYYRKAYELPNRVTDRERLYIVSHYYEYATGEIGRAIEDYELWRTLYPRDVVPANNLAVDYLAIGQPEKAMELSRVAIQLDPTNNIPYGSLANAYLMLGDYINVLKLCNDPVYGKMNVLGFHRVCYRAAFAQNDELGMQQQMQWAHGNPGESLALDDAAWVAMYRGKISEARGLFSIAKENAVRNNSIEGAADIQLDEANLDADFGYRQGAREAALSVLKLSFESPSEQAYAARALARVGEVSQAQAIAQKAAAQAPLDTILNSAMLATVDAAIQLQIHDPKAAIRSLEKTRPLDYCSEMELAPAYYRGLAYLQDKQFKRAAEEFQKVIAHRALADFPVYVTLSQLELGRAFQLVGNKSNAARAYSEVDKVWKDAEPGFPPLVQLRTYERELDAGAPTQRLLQEP
jgi:DNA-binding winged helix-turn-helix (wHTH) protein/tetratricopeptide (TPR) repeat protein